MSSNRVYGDLQVLAPSNAAFGTGALTVAAGLNVTGGITTPASTAMTINALGTATLETTSGATSQLILTNTTTNANNGQANAAVLVNATTGGVYVNAPTASTGIITLNSGAGVTVSGGAGAVAINSMTGGLNLGTDATAGNIVIGNTSKTTTINGPLNVTGTMTTINSTVLDVADQALTIHCAPAASSDSSVMFQRYGADISGDSNTNTYTATTVNIAQAQQAHPPLLRTQEPVPVFCTARSRPRLYGTQSLRSPGLRVHTP